MNIAQQRRRRVAMMMSGGYPSLAATSVSGLLSYWDPLNISTLFQEIAGTTPVAANGDNVGHMAGLVNAVSSADDTTRPTYAAAGINGFPAIRFVGASSQKLTANALGPLLQGEDTPFTCASVVQVTTPGTTQCVYSSGRSSSAQPFNIGRAFSTAKWDVLRRADANPAVQVTPDTPLVVGGLAVVFWVRFSGQAVEVGINETRLIGPVAMDVGTLTQDRFTLGALGTNTYSQFLTGFLGRFALYSVSLSDAHLMGLVRNFKGAYRI